LQTAGARLIYIIIALINDHELVFRKYLDGIAESVDELELQTGVSSRLKEPGSQVRIQISLLGQGLAAPS